MTCVDLPQKKELFLGLILLFSLMNGPSLYAQQSSLIADSAKVQRVSDQFAFTEGPAADARGNIFFTDQPNNQIWRYSTNGKLSLFMNHAGRSNGLYFDGQGNLIAAADEHDQLWSISPDKNVQVLVRNFSGHRLNGPNDVWVAPNGGIYFSDPYYQRDYWKRTHKEIKQERVYYLTPDRQQLKKVVSDLQKPNGLIGTPDGRTLYIADIGAGKTYGYHINDDGSLNHKKLFAPMGSDGMTIDARGNIYLTGKGVTVFDKTGKRIEQIVLPHQPANLTFGGSDDQTLFITARPAAYTLRMKVKGARSFAKK